MDAKIFRVNYKSDFILTLTSDAGWMTPFCIKFWTGSPMLAYYASYDGETYTHCTYDPSEPTKLTVQFDDHHLPIGNLKYQVAYHFTVADFPENTEDEVTNQANVTTVIDGDAYQVMLDLNGETAPEIQFALPAYANELQRIQNEQTRIAQEQQRIAQEQQRISQEAARVTEFNGIKAEALADHQRANEDHSRATSDHQNALADRSQADSDHSRAQSDHTTAGSDHSQANSDHIRAQSDHNTALSDHQTALSDHTQANTDHTRAESDHTRATADSSTAAADHRTASTDHTQANTDHARAESDHQRVETDLAEVEQYSNSLGAYDISAANATGSTLATYPDLATALGTNGSNIPEALRKGGMSVKFVQSSDNNSVYVQYRLMADDWSADVADWQGVDNNPTNGSGNLVQSGGVADAINEVAFSGFFVGKGESVSDFTGCVKVVKGHTYAVYPVLSSWDFGTTTNNKTVFCVSCLDSNEQEIVLDSVIYQYRSRLSGKLQVTIPDTIEANGSLLVYGRAAAGTKVWFEIVDITDVLAGDAVLEGRIAGLDRKFSVISFVGKGSTFSKSSTYCGVVAGRTYRIVMLDMSFAESEYSGIRQGVYYTDNNDTEKTIVEYNTQWVRQVFDITIPSDFKAGSSLIFGGRADAGVEVSAYVYDITNILAESSRAAAAEQALMETNKREDLFLFGDNVEEITGYISHTNGPHRVDNANSHYYLIPVKAGDKITANASSYYWCIFASRTVSGTNETYTYATGYSADKTNKPSEVVVPSDGAWLYVAKDYNSTSDGVTEILVNGIDVLGGGIVPQVAGVSAWIDVNSGVVAKSINDVEIHDDNLNGVKQWLGYIKDNTKAWVYNTQYYTYLIPVKEGDVVNVRDTSGHVYIVVLSSVSYAANGNISSVTYATGYASQTKVSENSVTIPADGHYFYIQGNVSDGVDNIKHFDINGFDVLKGGALSQVETLQEKMDIIYPLVPSDGSIVALNGGETHMKLVMDNLVRKQGTNPLPGEDGFTGNRPFVLLYFSDIHGKSDGSKDELAISRIVAFKNKYSTYLSDTLHGGDGVYTKMSEESTLDYDGAEDILNTIGNHDVLSGNTFADAQAAYNKFLAGKIENWGVEYTENLCYYYKDYSTSKLRLIVLDCMHWDSTQNTWLAATLADAAENDLSVVICDHYVPNANFTILREGCTFSTLDPGTGDFVQYLDAQASATVQAAIDDATHPLDFVCWLFGHTHKDYFGYLTDYPDQYAICIAKASGDYSGWEQDSVRTVGTKAYDCLDLISVDTTAGVLSITRLGNNTDRFMRQKNYLAFDYANHKIMGNS